MERNISIRPSKDIRTNYAKISELTRQNPVAITVNGREDTVLLSHEDFSRQIKPIKLKKNKGILKSRLRVRSAEGEARTPRDTGEYSHHSLHYIIKVDLYRLFLLRS